MVSCREERSSRWHIAKGGKIQVGKAVGIKRRQLLDDLTASPHSGQGKACAFRGHVAGAESHLSRFDQVRNQVEAGREFRQGGTE